MSKDERSPLAGRHVLSVGQFDRELLGTVFGRAREMRRMVESVGGGRALADRVLTCLFYEPSTRTSSSFLAAMQRLGGRVIPINGVQFSSVGKGESLPDTVRTLGQYSDAIVLRHPEEGAVALAAEYSPVPIINAGDGVGEHPTQALLDLFTIQEELGQLDGLTVAMVGDLRYGRTVHSLTKLLLLYDVRLRFVSPDTLRLPMALRNQAEAAGRSIRETHDLSEVVREADVLYATRIQRERFSDTAAYEQVRGQYLVDLLLLRQAKERMVVMHPLPRVDELAPEVDTDPRAAYFRQVRNGMLVRMALLTLVLGQ